MTDRTVYDDIAEQCARHDDGRSSCPVEAEKNEKKRQTGQGLYDETSVTTPQEGKIMEGLATPKEVELHADEAAKRVFVSRILAVRADYAQMRVDGTLQAAEAMYQMLAREVLEYLEAYTPITDSRTKLMTVILPGRKGTIAAGTLVLYFVGRWNEECRPDWQLVDDARQMVLTLPHQSAGGTEP